MSSPESRDALVFVGTVTQIRPSPGEVGRWAVTMTVTRVLAGAFDGATFSFLVHSPSKSDLEEGRTYTVRATRTDGGYTVDEMQWRLPPEPAT